VALADALRGQGTEAHVWNCHPPPAHARFIDARNYVTLVPQEAVAALPPVDAIVSLDTAEGTRLGISSLRDGPRGP